MLDAPAPPQQEAPARLSGRSELGLGVLLVGLGAFLLVETSRIAVPAASAAIGPRFFPTVVGGLLVVVGGWLSVDVLRGGHGEMETAEDVDVDRSSDWRTLLLLSAVFLGHAALLEPAGFPIAAALLFFGTATTLGSRRPLRDAVVSVALGVLVHVVFARLLGVGLPAGVLEGVL